MEVVGAGVRCHGRDVSLSLIGTRWLFPLRDRVLVTVASGPSGCANQPCTMELPAPNFIRWVPSFGPLPPNAGYHMADPELPETLHQKTKTRMDEKTHFTHHMGRNLPLERAN